MPLPPLLFIHAHTVSENSLYKFSCFYLKRFNLNFKWALTMTWISNYNNSLHIRFATDSYVSSWVCFHTSSHSSQSSGFPFPQGMGDDRVLKIRNRTYFPLIVLQTWLLKLGQYVCTDCTHSFIIPVSRTFVSCDSKISWGHTSTRSKIVCYMRYLHVLIYTY